VIVNEFGVVDQDIELVDVPDLDDFDTDFEPIAV
jgi:hypothetical protein